MLSDHVPIDQLLAAALRGENAGWPSDWTDDNHIAQANERIAYHGISGLLPAGAHSLGDWPTPVLEKLREQAIALAMWEMRHKVVLGELVTALAEASIVALLLKGTALAYDLYPTPATRARGDSDLLVAPADLAATRSVLAGLGYRRQSLEEGIADDLALQEVWSLTCGAGTHHHLDLHWQLLNAPALRGVLDFAVCATEPCALAKLSPHAMTMNRVLTLLHTCIHRAMHLTSPYFVNGVTYYGGDRLIWAKDIDLLAGALSEDEWDRFAALALQQGVAAVSLDGLQMAGQSLATLIPQRMLEQLGGACDEPASAYLLNTKQVGRAWKDLHAIRGWPRKLAYLAARAVPPKSFMREKYPELGSSPLALLHLRRMIDLLRPRTERKRQV